MANHIGAPSNRKNYHKVGAINFQKDFLNVLSSFTDEVSDAIGEEVIAMANKGCEELQRAKFPMGSENGTAKPMKRRMWKKYASSWCVEKTIGTNFVKARIRNRKYYRLTHLLENGHATRDGKRTRAFAHIKPVEKEVNEELEKNIKRIIEKGGKL